MGPYNSMMPKDMKPPANVGNETPQRVLPPGQALDEAVAAIYFADSSDYLSALWKIVSLLGGDEAVALLESDVSAAYKKYCSGAAGVDIGQYFPGGMH